MPCQSSPPRAQAFHTEFAFTQAVIRELNTRTTFQVLNKDADADADADATLQGVILTQSASPLTYDSSSGQTSSYLITITARVTLTDRNGRVLYQNDSLPFHEQYQSTQDISTFIQEDSPAVQAHRPRLRPVRRLGYPGVLLMAASGNHQVKSFAGVDRFLAEIASPRLKPGYVLVGHEAFLYQRCRAGILATLAPLESRDFGLHDLDLADTSIFDILDQANTPSLMAPFQVFFVRNLKTLYGRGSKKEEFAAIDAYFRRPNPQALLVFVADHLSIPTDLRRMDFQDKERFDRIRETLGEWCGLIELARVAEADAVRWLAEEAPARGVRIDPDAARELVDALGADMMLIASDFEKLCLYAQGKQLLLAGGQASVAHSSQPHRDEWEPTTAPSPLPPPIITLGDVETMVLAAKQRSLYELTDAISRRDRPAALALLHGLLNASDGGEDSAIGHLYMLARTFRQMLVVLERNVRDSRAIWSVLWQGFRMPPFAAEDLIRQARRYESRGDLTRALRQIARADLEVRSNPPDKRLVLERLVLALSTEARQQPSAVFTQFAMEL